VTTEGYTWHVLVGQEMRAITVPTEVGALMERAPSPETALP
jgi:hypothetical protein